MAFISMMFVGVVLFLFVLGIGGIILGIVLRIVNSKRVKKGTGKSRALSVGSIISFIGGGLSLVPMLFIIGFNISSDVSEAAWQRDSLEYNVDANDIDRAKALLEEGADPNTYEQYIYPPLYFALENNNYDMTKMLFEYGADPDATGAWNTQMFHFAVQNNGLDFVALFVDNGADINSVVSDQTPLDVAHTTGKDEVIQYLVDKGALTFAEIG